MTPRSLYATPFSYVWFTRITHSSKPRSFCFRAIRGVRQRAPPDFQRKQLGVLPWRRRHKLLQTYPVASHVEYSIPFWRHILLCLRSSTLLHSTPAARFLSSDILAEAPVSIVWMEKRPWTRNSVLAATASSRACAIAMHGGCIDGSILCDLSSWLGSLSGTCVIMDSIAFHRSSVERISVCSHVQRAA